MRLTINGTELFFDVEGAQLAPSGASMEARPTLLLIHGGPGFDHSCFKPYLSPLADVAQLLYVDLRGQGRSGRPPLETCSAAQMATDVAELCRALDIQRPTVLGHSFGGFVALHLAVQHPDVAGKLVLANTAAARADMAGGMELLEMLNGPAARAAVERMFGGDFSEAALEDFGRLAWPAYFGDPGANDEALTSIMPRSITNFDVAAHYFEHFHPSFDLRAQLAGIDVPALIITGSDDWVCHADASRKMAAIMPHAELLEIPGTRHFSFIERPDIVLPAIRRFVGAAVPAVAAR